ncbi:MAG: radical SAM protein, partial [Chloroflexota bacterium]|nr:radical SAM protein [Chloroflexota bacterium]
GLVALAERLATDGDAPATQPEPVVALARQRFQVPDRNGLPALARYAHLTMGDGSTRVVGNTEASRGCKNLCRHCPIVPVYGGRFFIVQPEVVLADIEQQVAAGARHITFGDPDFFNGPTHAMRVVEELHQRFPDVTYDVTIKVEHLLRHQAHLSRLREAGCLFVTSAVEAVDDGILEIFDKHHTREDFIEVVALLCEVGIHFNPTFVTFNPWISVDGYRALLRVVADLDLVQNVSPIQYAIRLLIPAGSRLLELEAVRDLVGAFDPASMIYPWRHADPRVDQLHADVMAVVSDDGVNQGDRASIFARVWDLTEDACEMPVGQRVRPLPARNLHLAPIPHLSEPWYCCAEPTELQLTTRDPV